MYSLNNSEPKISHTHFVIPPKQFDTYLLEKHKKIYKVTLHNKKKKNRKRYDLLKFKKFLESLKILKTLLSLLRGVTNK